MTRPTDLPSHLIDRVRGGDCVAFVGAGFSAAARLPMWGDLLRDIASVADEDVRGRVMGLVAKGSAHALDQAAQTLEDHLRRERFVDEVRLRLGRPAITTVMARRLEWLKGIPFRAILTTNFDGVLDGAPPGSSQYAQVLRPTGHRWWEEGFWKDSVGACRIKLHGDATPERENDIVLTRLDYRRRLYGDAAYMTFLRSVFATSTVLYLGCSFDDAYLNELRSEVLALIGHRGEEEPVAYAVLNDVPEATRDYFLRHEGIRILGYDTNGGLDWSGFDRHLEALFEATNPLPMFGRLLADRRILWIDPYPENNRPILDFFARATAASGTAEAGIVIAATAEEGLLRLASNKASFHLTITHWGEPPEPGGVATAVQLIEGMRRSDLRCPVLVFSTMSAADTRKPVVLGLGAQGYCHSWNGLLRRIAEIFGPGSDGD